jgi:hypothetical protein
MALTSTLCPYCHRHTHTTLRWGHVYERATRIRFAATCDNCSRLLVAEGYGSQLRAPGYTEDSTNLSTVIEAAERAEAFTWLPLAAESPDVPDVPDSISRATKEAFSNATIGNHMSSILMARTVIEATAKAKGFTSGTLSAKINALRDEQYIRPAIADLAHEIRFFGNDMAHGDIDDAPTAEDAEEILALMAEVLAEVFQGPARLQRLQAKRVAATS